MLTQSDGASRAAPFDALKISRGHGPASTAHMSFTASGGLAECGRIVTASHVESVLEDITVA